MKQILFILILICTFVAVSSTGFAKDNLWEQELVQALKKGKPSAVTEGGGQGYTPSEEIVLETAIKKALEMNAPPCETMKIAVDLKYSPYLVIKNIFDQGGKIGLNQLCMCATESGIGKQIVAKAASDAASPIGTPMFPRDEIVQAQCIGLEGLGYTATDEPPPYIPLAKATSVSSIAPQ